MHLIVVKYSISWEIKFGRLSNMALLRKLICVIMK